jgi:hypothetical protein
MRLSYALSDYPREIIEIECDKCGRHGRLRTARLLAEHEPDIKLPDLLREIAKCPKWGSMDDGCRARYSASSRRRAAGARPSRVALFLPE